MEKEPQVKCGRAHCGPQCPPPNDFLQWNIKILAAAKPYEKVATFPETGVPAWADRWYYCHNRSPTEEADGLDGGQQTKRARVLLGAVQVCWLPGEGATQARLCLDLHKSTQLPCPSIREGHIKARVYSAF